MTETHRLLGLLGEPVAPPGCGGEHAIALFVAGDADEATTHHVTGCADCAARSKSARDDNAAFLALRPWSTMESLVDARLAERPPWWRRLLSPRPLAGLAAVAATALVVATLPEAPTESSVRVKGRRSVSFFVKVGDTAVHGDPNAIYKPGDRLQFRYSETGEYQWLLIVGLDGTGAVSTWYDDDGRSVPIRPGRARLLEGSVILDERLGPERAFACFSQERLATGDVSAHLRTTGELPLACHTVTITLDKAP